jgi:hypothetical protein
MPLLACTRFQPAVAKFAKEKIAPRVRAMDDAATMDPDIIRGLFDAGVSRLT